jgi:ubiquinone/menaquinone biosynthesis C-methylase UbiE
MSGEYDDVVAANVRLHTSMSEQYQTCEPHYRPENRRNVERKFLAAIDGIEARKMLDLGCGAGFMIDLAKEHVAEIHGVDVTPAMLARVDRSGPAEITLHEGDTGKFDVDPGTFDVVTAYSFLHHLFDVRPTLQTAARSLRPGGRFYADLEPNAHFWHAIEELERAGGEYDPIVMREIQAVQHRDDEIQEEFGVSADDFNRAEWGKSMQGGFTPEALGEQILEAGFSSVDFFYEWFVGRGQIINDPELSPEQRTVHAEAIDDLLERALPLSRGLFKYVGFVATR